MTHEEEEEVRSLLIRHKDRIIIDLVGTDLITILVKNSVITTIEEELLMLHNINIKTNSTTNNITTTITTTNNENLLKNFNDTKNLNKNNKLLKTNINNDCNFSGTVSVGSNSSSEDTTISSSSPSNNGEGVNNSDPNNINSGSSDDTITINNVDDDDNDNDKTTNYLELKCLKLIDIIAKNGFQRFKQFCYAIENECPQLIEDLINDRLNNDSHTVPISSNEEKIKEDESENSEKDKTDSDRSRRSTSYGGTTTTTTPNGHSIPIAAPRRKSLMSVPPPPPPPASLSMQQIVVQQKLPSGATSPSTIPSKFPQSELNLAYQKGDPTNIITISNNPSSSNATNNSNNNQINQINQIQSYYQSPSTLSSSNYSSLLCHASSASSPAVVRKREKLLHRFSDAATLGRKLKKKKNTNRGCHSMTEAIEMLADPVIEDDFFGDRTSWEYHTVSVTRVPGYGFGIAVSGGRDNPHFANGDPSIAVSDVLKGGPAEDRLQVNDRIISVNGVSLENVEYATAVQVLRDSGNTVTLVVKRRVPIAIPHQHTHSLSGVGLAGGGNLINQISSVSPPANNINPGQPIKVMLSKSSKKEDFGIVLGCRLFIKEISSKARDQLAANGYSLQEGDIVTRIHNTNCNDSMSMKEAKKIIDGCKERLNLVVLRDITNQAAALNSGTQLNNSVASGVQASAYSHNQQISNCSNNLDDPYLSGGNYSSQNLYVQPPTRGGVGVLPILGDEKSNLTPRGRSRGPLMDVSLSQLDRPATPPGGISSGIRRPDDPPRPPPPREENFYSSRRQLYEDDPLQRSRQSAEPRFISFQKEGSVGIRLTGGNEAGIFVTAVQPGSPASLQGLTPGDKILKVNEMDMHGVTREEAVLFLLSLQDRIDLIVQYCKEEYEEVVANQRGDSFHIKTHFHCENPSKGEMAFKAGDCFRVIDTLHNGVVGSWQVLKIGRGHQEMQRGVIPNKSRAEELATAQFNATKKEMNASESRGNFFRRRRSTHRRSKSLSRENWDDVVFSDSISKFPAYERVVLRHPGFVRPVVLFGPVSDLARDKLTKDFPDKFTAPLQDDDKSNSKCRIVRLSNIRDIMDRGKHALLDITPNAVDRLNYAQFYPIVIFLKTDTKHVIKQLRQGIPKSAHKSSKKLLEQCLKLDKVWSHVFSTQITLNDTDSWYRKLREAIDLQQSGAVWMSESKLPELPPAEMYFPPYIAPPCQLPCCRPTSIPRYPPIRSQLTLAAIRSLTPPRNLTNIEIPPPIPPSPINMLPPSTGYNTVPIIRSSASMPGGFIKSSSPTLPSQNFDPIKLQTIRSEPQYIRTSQPNLLQSFGKIQKSQLPHQQSICSQPSDSLSMTNFNSATSLSQNSNLQMDMKNNNERRSTPYYYNELHKTESAIFDSNLNLRCYGSEDQRSTTTVSKEELVDDLETNDNIRYDNLSSLLNGYNYSSSGNMNSLKFKKNLKNDAGHMANGNIGGSNGNILNESNNSSSNLGFITPIPAARNYATNPVESLSDDFLFPMTTSRLSYASSPESDLELSPGPSASLSLGNLPQLVKSSSDPSIATNQDNLDRDRDIVGEGLPPPYTHPYDHSNPPQNRRTTIDNKFSYTAGNPSQQLTPETNSNRPQSMYGINAPDLPPRIDRGVKPPGSANPQGILSSPHSATPSRTNSSGGGTIGRSAQERLFGKQQQSQQPTDSHNSGADDYVTRNNNTDSMDRTQNSLDRSRIIGKPGVGPNVVTQNGSYDSVSSYDSYNTTQLSVQNIRLGPNAPDDLKSVPSVNGRPPPPATVGPNTPEYRGIHDHSRSFGGANDLNRQNSPGRPPHHDVNSPRNIDPRNSQPGINLPQRPSNLVLENSPRKPVLETKTDYGKYSRNNSASQADYASKLPKSPHIGGGVPPGINGHGQLQSSPSTNGNGGGMPFKPVPPPKPKNYRPPIQQGGGPNHWDNNGDSGSPRSPNGFFYPPTPSHHHYNSQQGISGSPHNPNGNQQPIHAYGHYNAGNGGQQQQQQQQPPYPPTNGYNSSGGSNHIYGGQYIQHRGHAPPPIGNIPHHTPERHALDLAGSREQRGSAFELYRKPQIGTAGHHHNMSEMEPHERYYYENSPHHPHQSQYHHQQQHNNMIYDELNEQNYRHFYASNSGSSGNGTPPPLPPPLPSNKSKKKSVLKSPLIALKNAIIKSTRPLRRMNSMVEPERKIKPCLRRQYSMMERQMNRVHYPEEYSSYATQPMPPRHQYPSHEQYYPNDMINSTYQNLETEDIYGNTMQGHRDRLRLQQQQYQQQVQMDDMYANRALIDLERRQAESRIAGSGRRIVRRHSTADRTGSQRPVIIQRSVYEPEDIYQSRQGAYMLQERRAPGSEVMQRRRFYSDPRQQQDEPTYQSRREMHRSHLYQSRKEMQERIAQGKKEIEREFSPPQSSSQSERDDKSDRESVYQSRKEAVRDIGLKSRSQLRDQIYQTRRDAMESMAEPIYVSKREVVVKHEPIYESREESGVSRENITDERKHEDKDIDNNSDETTHSDLQRSNDTVIENSIASIEQKAPLANTEEDQLDEEDSSSTKLPASPTTTKVPTQIETSAPSTPREFRAPFHISNIIKRTAPPPTEPPPGITMSRTSLETQYTSQASLPVGPPNASSTPYASDLSLPMNGPVPISMSSSYNQVSITSDTDKTVIPTTIQQSQFPTVPREPSTTRGIFDENGGTLCDNVWNVSLQIPAGAIRSGVKQEIYFTVTDPRMSQTVGGRPLDMENGETMLSPLVMCGPQGLEFNVPVTLNIPHCAGRTASLGLALKATDSEKNLHTEWDNIDLPSNTAAHTVSVKVDHF